MTKPEIGVHATTAFLFPGPAPYPSPSAIVDGLRECQIAQIYAHKAMWHWSAPGRATDEWLRNFVSECEAFGIQVGAHVGMVGNEPMNDAWLAKVRERIMAFRIGGLVYADDAEESQVAVATALDSTLRAYVGKLNAPGLHPYGPNRQPYLREASAGWQVRDLVTGTGSGDRGNDIDECKMYALASSITNPGPTKKNPNAVRNHRATFGWWGEHISGDFAPIVPLPFDAYSKAWKAAWSAEASITYRTTLQAMTAPEFANVRQLIGGMEQMKRALEAK